MNTRMYTHSIRHAALSYISCCPCIMCVHCSIRICTPCIQCTLVNLPKYFGYIHASFYSAVSPVICVYCRSYFVLFKSDLIYIAAITYSGYIFLMKWKPKNNYCQLCLFAYRSIGPWTETTEGWMSCGVYEIESTWLIVHMQLLIVQLWSKSLNATWNRARRYHA